MTAFLLVLLRSRIAWGVAVALACVLALKGYGHAQFKAGARTERAAIAAEQAKAAIELSKRVLQADNASADATITARVASAHRIVDIQSRRQQAEEIAREPREAVPAGCPAPDDRLVRLDREAAGNIRGATDRLRGLRPAPDGSAQSAAARK